MHPVLFGCGVDGVLKDGEFKKNKVGHQCREE